MRPRMWNFRVIAPKIELSLNARPVPAVQMKYKKAARR
jgi:hypothetical protein